MLTHGRPARALGLGATSAVILVATALGLACRPDGRDVRV